MHQIWNPITFGRHKDRTLPSLVFHDPGYFFWGCEEAIFRGSLLGQAVGVHRRATAVRIPSRFGSNVAVEYIVAHGKFEGLNIVPANMVQDGGGSSSFVKPVIDMSVPRALDAYDKGGMKMLVRDLKEICFGDASYRMSAERSAGFFEDDTNFVLTSGAE
jgi:hypothetical protein